MRIQRRYWMQKEKVKDMKVTNKGMMFLGLDSFRGSKDPTKTYYRVTFADPPSSMEIFVDPNVAAIASELSAFSFVDVEFDISSTQKGFRVEVADMALSDKGNPFAAAPSPAFPEKSGKKGV